MKQFKILNILLFSLVISFYSCKDKETTESNKQEAVPLKLLDSPSQQNAGSKWHYTCNKGCNGGAPSAGNCATCGNALVHNQAYHNDPNNITTSTTQTTPTNPVTTPKAEPSQNAAGVWHYTCGQGCSGGAGSATKCGTCGNTLAHNAAYH